VAASRARDRMYLVRSVKPEDLSAADTLRRSLIAHFSAPFAQDEERVQDLRELCESPFEREMYDELTERGYWVTPQVRVGQYRIDMVVEGHNDARLAVECDGDKYHGPDKWADDMQRQRDLERAGWVFWRCFAAAFTRRRKDMMDDLLKTLAERGVEPIGAEGAPRSVHTEQRVVSTAPTPVIEVSLMSIDLSESARETTPALLTPCSPTQIDLFPLEDGQRPCSTDERGHFDREHVLVSLVESRSSNLPLSNYTEYSGPAGPDPRNVSPEIISAGLVQIIEVEGPVLAKRVYDIYLRNCGIMRMRDEVKKAMNKALAHAIRQGHVVSEDEAAKSGILYSVVRVKGSEPIRLRTRGPRSLEEIPPSELQVVARYLAELHGFASGSEQHLRAVLDHLDLKRLTSQANTTLVNLLERNFAYVDEFLIAIRK